MALAGEINMTVSQAIIDEMAGILARKFQMSDEIIAEAKSIVRDAARLVTPAVQLRVVKADPDDDKIVECAVSAGSNDIMTGDKHLLRLKTYDAIRIVKVADFLALMRGTQGR